LSRESRFAHKSIIRNVFCAAICCYDFYHKLPEEQSGKDRNGFAWFSYNKILLKDMKPVVNSEF
ncbi:hypothetical protein BMS84_10740, partial [Leuconostoc pseudomesenteroides]